MRCTWQLWLTSYAAAFVPQRVAPWLRASRGGRLSLHSPPLSLEPPFRGRPLLSTVEPEDDDAIDSEVVPDWEVDLGTDGEESESSVTRTVEASDRSDDGTR